MQRTNDESIKRELKSAKDELITTAEENAMLKQRISELESKPKLPPPPPNDQSFKLKALEKQLSEEKNKFSELEKEQEDLLVCMGKSCINLCIYTA